MRRISVEEVRAAYEKTGLKPARTVAGCVHGRCACALGAMWVVAGKPTATAYLWAGDLFGVEYMRNFYCGFDNSSIGAGTAGYADGQACAAAIFGGTP